MRSRRLQWVSRARPAYFSAVPDFELLVDLTMTHVDEMRPIHNLASLEELCTALADDRLSREFDPIRRVS